jgi:hypothetical protein
MHQIEFIRTGKQIETKGLGIVGLQELRIEVSELGLIPYAESLVHFVTKYLHETGRTIAAGETMAYGYWLVKFQRADDFLEVWEYDPEATSFVRGASLALTYWRDQHAVCANHQAQFMPPRPDRLTVVDDGVLAGLPIQAVRYPSPEHMSGWWITTDAYNGDVSTLRREHTYHITAARPEVAAYLALPYGFRFNLGPSYADAWFEERVAAQPAG